MSVRDLLRSNGQRFRAMAESLDADDWARPSLCDGWSNHDVLAHLVIGYRAGPGVLVAEMLRHAGSFDRANAAIARSLPRHGVPASYSTTSSGWPSGHADWVATFPAGCCSATTSPTNSTSCSRSSASRRCRRMRRSRC